ncbi:RAMP superfamily CRISPR-associated protein [Promicromonospora alba]|uniref:RAMP superfamily CRISPR-associated protein n=1 Tax=Promicromonospora alba TaxID=1616110 RepID=A0ABV9HCZ9_9MICO
MTALILDLTFHSPFRVATGLARPGLQDTIDPQDLLPATTLKGLLRASAEQLTEDALHGEPLVGAVFGTKRSASPWAFGSVEWLAPWQTVVRTRVALDPVQGAARRDALYTAEEVAFSDTAPVPHARLRIDQYHPLPPDLPEREDHLVVLSCAAAGVHHLGADRRRGLGWVTITPHHADGAHAVTAATITRLHDLSARPASSAHVVPEDTDA